MGSDAESHRRHQEETGSSGPHAVDVCDISLVSLCPNLLQICLPTLKTGFRVTHTAALEKSLGHRLPALHNHPHSGILWVETVSSMTAFSDIGVVPHKTQSLLTDNHALDSCNTARQMLFPHYKRGSGLWRPHDLSKFTYWCKRQS